MAIEEQAKKPTRPVALGQLVAGGVIGGIALWSIALHASDTTPSAMLAGVAETYRTWRDWLMEPLLERAQIRLDPLHRDVLAFDLVMIGAWVRTALRFPSAWEGLADLALWPSIAVAAIYFAMPDTWSASNGVELWIWIAAAICVLDLLMGPFVGLMGRFIDESAASHLAHLTAPPALFALWNVLAIFALAAGLLALDWSIR